MKILSVDWDYFFPNLIGFDWGMSENRFESLQSALWLFRYNNRNMITRQYAYDLKPAYQHFWEKIKIHNDIESVIIADSHADILQIIDEECIVWNIDQHHDRGYRHTGSLLDCESWALHSNIVQYNLIYPSWRKDSLEKSPTREADSISFDRGFDMSERFDVAFICRSSAWAPPWCDYQWKSFLSDFSREFPQAWLNRKVLDDVLEMRQFDYAQAENIKKVIEGNDIR